MAHAIRLPQVYICSGEPGSQGYACLTEVHGVGQQLVTVPTSNGAASLVFSTDSQGRRSGFVATYEDASTVCSTNAHCSNRGTCEFGSCVCDPGWFGRACSAQHCEGLVSHSVTNANLTAAAAQGRFESQDAALPVESDAHCTWSFDTSALSAAESRAGMRVVFDRFSLEPRQPNEDYVQVVWESHVDTLRVDPCVTRGDCDQWYHAGTCVNEACEVRRVIEAASSTVSIELRTDRNDNGLSFSGVAGTWHALYECPASSQSCHDGGGECSTGACFLEGIAVNCSCASSCPRGYRLVLADGGSSECVVCSPGQYEVDGQFCNNVESQFFIQVEGQYAVSGLRDASGESLPATGSTRCPTGSRVQERQLEPNVQPAGCPNGECLTYPLIWQRIRGGSSLRDCKCEPGHYYRLPSVALSPPPAPPPPASPPPGAPINCPCIPSFSDGVLGRTSDGLDVFIAIIGDAQYQFDATYGLAVCLAHDNGTPPFCNQTDASARPGWCSDNWCFINESNCNTVSYLSSYRPDAGLRYSYSACSVGANSFLEDFTAATDLGLTLDLEVGCTDCPVGARCLGEFIQPLALP